MKKAEAISFLIICCVLSMNVVIPLSLTTNSFDG